jgi:tetratricopeptide (TPR) repeat protein
MKCKHCGADNAANFKFCEHCGTPLTNPLISRESPPTVPESFPVTSGTVTGHTKLVRLSCPSCGGALELPDNLTVAHCIYCGTKILLDQDGVVQERRDLARYIELCKVSVEAKNHKEVIEYCNRILEIDPKNIDAWINKAVSTFWLTTGAHNRYDEAMEYLAKASQIAPDDAKIGETRRELTREQVQWYCYLGNQQWEMAQKRYKSEYEYYKRLAYVWPGHNAKVATAQYALKAMEYYVIASNYAPDNITVLQTIANVASFYDVVTWGEKVHAKLRSLELLRAKINASGRLPKLRRELQEAQSELAKLQTQSGFFVGLKINDVQNRITRLQSDIAKSEIDSAYNPMR